MKLSSVVIPNIAANVLGIAEGGGIKPPKLN